MVTDNSISYADWGKPPKLHDTPDPITGKRRDRQVIRTDDLNDETLDAILNAEPGERSKADGKL